MLPEDPILDEIRRVRHRISAQFDHDPFKLVEYYMKLQEADQDRWGETAKVVNPAERSRPVEWASQVGMATGLSLPTTLP